MSKHSTTQWFLAALVAFVAGLALGAIGAIVAFTNDVFIMSGPDVVGVGWTTATWIALAFCIVAALAMTGALVAGFVSWIGAVVHTSQAADKTWFIILLITGLVGLGLPAMLAYVIAGPADAQQARPTDADNQTQAGPVSVS